MNRKKMAVTWMGVMLSLTFVVIFVKTAPVTAKTIYVDDDGTADYSNIQAAIDIANPGDIVYVYSGTYYENLDIPKTISLIG